MKFFHDQGTCSTGIRVILEELELPYDIVSVQLGKGEQNKPEFRAVNPKGKVPALLRDDGKLMTEFQSIAYWLANSHPNSGIFPKDLDDQAACLEILDFVVATVHMRGTTLALLPQKFTGVETAQADIRAHGTSVANAGLQVLSERLGDKPYFMGDHFTIADAAVYYVLRWQERFAMEVPENLAAFRARMLTRPAVQRAEMPV